MAGKALYKLKINEDFKQLIPPLSSEERKQLEQNITRDGCLEPLCIWNNTIIDGHNRYEICLRLNIPFLIRRMSFKNREEATAWICANQLGRRNITEEARRYLIGKRFEMEKILGAHNAAGTNQFKRKELRPKMLVEPTYDKYTRRTSERLGEEYHISHATVDKYGTYAHALDTLSGIIPEFVSKILSGQIKISQDNVIELSRLSLQDILRLNKYASSRSIDSVGYSEIREILPKKHEFPRKNPPSIPSGSVKNMPKYDPDSEVSGLIFTIPSWVSSINRTHSTANFSEISLNAKYKLEQELSELSETIENMIREIRRYSNG